MTPMVKREIIRSDAKRKRQLHTASTLFIRPEAVLPGKLDDQDGVLQARPTRTIKLICEDVIVAVSQPDAAMAENKSLEQSG